MNINPAPSIERLKAFDICSPTYKQVNNHNVTVDVLIPKETKPGKHPTIVRFHGGFLARHYLHAAHRHSVLTSHTDFWLKFVPRYLPAMDHGFRFEVFSHRCQPQLSQVARIKRFRHSAEHFRLLAMVS